MLDSEKNKYDAVIGLEIHIQLLTDSKAFSADYTNYGDLPNSNISPVSVGYPGALPKVNKNVIEYAVRLGLALNAKIDRNIVFSRKNYFYPDMPKGYQITQYKYPICSNGHIIIKDKDKNEKKINIKRIHIEEDSAKSIHHLSKNHTFIDYNRAGVPLLEIVTKSEISSGTEAVNFINEIRKLVRFLNICDGDMEKGSLRCDANVSVKLKTSKILGNRIEIKNLNSTGNLKKAIEYEISNQINNISLGQKILQQTKGFNADTGKTFKLRDKEDINEYRYFPEPDINPVVLSQEYIENIKQHLPVLPFVLYKKYTNGLGISAQAAESITENKNIVAFFEEVIKHTTHYSLAANFITISLKKYLNENNLNFSDIKLKPEYFAQLIELIEEHKIIKLIAENNLLPLMIDNPNLSPFEIAEENNFIVDKDLSNINNNIKIVIKKYPGKVKEYKNGNKALMGLFMGEIMKMTNYKADPKLVNKLLLKILDE